MNRILMEDVKINRKPRSINPHVSKSIPKESFEDKISQKIETRILEKKIDHKTSRRMSTTPRDYNRKPVRGFLKFFLIISMISGFIFWTGFLFQSAYVTVTAKQQDIEYKLKILHASRELGSSEIDFEIMIETEKKSRDYILTESKEVSSKATGSIILFNEFSTKSEKLISGTYISDQEGKTYRLNSTVTIPGYKMEKDKKIPGQVEVGVTSFLAGENYNGNPEKFYINSFKGTTKYSKIYGKPKSELHGGLQGLVYYLTEEDKIKLKQIAESSFKDELYSKVRALLPSGYVLYPGAIRFSYNIEEDVMSDTPEVKVSIVGTLNAILIKEDSLIKNIIKISIPEATQEEIPEIIITGIKDLNFILNENQQIDKSLNVFDFYLTGALKATWNPNKDILKSKLLGVHKDKVLPIFRENVGITKALVRIFPPWNKYLPNNPSKININIK